LGSAARSTEAALTALPARVASLDLSDRIVTGRVDREKPSIEGMPFDVSIFHLNPDELISYASDSLAYRLGTGWNIGFFFWETDRIPDSWREGIDAVDEIWVGSNFVAEAFRRVTSKEVRIVGLPVEPVDVSRSERLGDSEFVVSYVADLGSGVARKNPLAAVDAFRLAFDGEFENVRLVMKLGSLNRFPRLRSRLEIAARGMPLDIHEGYLGHSQLRSLIAESDVYLSLHRSEGLGLTMLEAMELGVPVVATGYGGNTEFMSDESGRLVDYVLVTAGDDAGPYVGHRWAEPDIAHAAAQVRELRADPQLRSSIGQRGRDIVRSRYSADAFCARIAAALEQAGLTRGGREVPSGRR
jgi:glycosyltransferase involved in cell wall biosynthesis